MKRESGCIISSRTFRQVPDDANRLNFIGSKILAKLGALLLPILKKLRPGSRLGFEANELMGHRLLINRER